MLRVSNGAVNVTGIQWGSYCYGYPMEYLMLRVSNGAVNVTGI